MQPIYVVAILRQWQDQGITGKSLTHRPCHCCSWVQKLEGNCTRLRVACLRSTRIYILTWQYHRGQQLVGVHGVVLSNATKGAFGLAIPVLSYQSSTQFLKQSSFTMLSFLLVEAAGICSESIETFCSPRNFGFRKRATRSQTILSIHFTPDFLCIFIHSLQVLRLLSC